MPDTRGSLEKRLYDLTMQHLGRLKEYSPGPVKKAGAAGHLIRRYREDPVFSIFGLDSLVYVSAALSGGTITSIHRKIGDIYETCAKAVFSETLSIPEDELVYSTTIRSGSTKETRSADIYVEFAAVRDSGRRGNLVAFGQAELRALAKTPRIRLVGLAMEVRHCYQTGDSKRTQADEAMARHLLVSGILPIMPLFCSQSNPGIVRRYRTVWVVKEGIESYDMVKALSGFDLYGFMRRNRKEFRRPVIQMLRRLHQ